MMDIQALKFARQFKKQALLAPLQLSNAWTETFLQDLKDSWEKAEAAKEPTEYYEECAEQFFNALDAGRLIVKD